MKAIIETGGKQYTVTEGQEIFVEKLDVEEGKTVKFTNINKAPTFKLSVKGKKAVVKIKNFDKAGNGYQIKYSTNKNFKRAKTVNTKTAKATIKGLNTTKDYYVKVRKFVKGTNKNVYGKFSKVSKIINV